MSKKKPATYHDGIEGKDDGATDEGFGPDQVVGVEAGEGNHGWGADDEHPVADCLEDPLLVVGAQGHQLPHGGVAIVGQAEQLGKPEKLTRTQHPDPWSSMCVVLVQQYGVKDPLLSPVSIPRVELSVKKMVLNTRTADKMAIRAQPQFSSALGSLIKSRISFMMRDWK